MSGKFEALLPAVEKFARLVFDAGVRAERERILSDLGAPVRRAANAPLAYGVGCGAVIKVFDNIDFSDELGITDIAHRCPEISIAQARSAVKILVKSGKIIRVARGRYRSGVSQINGVAE